MGSSICKGALLDGTRFVFEGRSFASGEYRRAYKGTYVTGRNAGKPCVVKVYKSRFGVQEAIKTELEIASTAKKLGDEFNRRKIAKRRLTFLLPVEGVVESVTCLSSGVRAGDRVLVEDYIEGKYEKFISNNGTLKFHGTLSVFCHFTYHHTRGKILVVDIQGVRGKKEYLLTDPAIHSKSGNDLFGDLDLGDVGIQAFFGSHECLKGCYGWAMPSACNYTWKDCEKIMRKRSHRGGRSIVPDPDGEKGIWER